MLMLRARNGVAPVAVVTARRTAYKRQLWQSSARREAALQKAQVQAGIAYMFIEKSAI